MQSLLSFSLSFILTILLITYSHFAKPKCNYLPSLSLQVCWAEIVVEVDEEVAVGVALQTNHLERAEELSEDHIRLL
jgi:hypothetical protein